MVLFPCRWFNDGAMVVETAVIDPKTGKTYKANKDGVLNETGYINAAGDPPPSYYASYIDFIKAYETHVKDSKGNFVLDYNGSTIGYGHDLTAAEKSAGAYKNSISESQALALLKSDLNNKHCSIKSMIRTLNTSFGYSIKLSQFSKDEYYFLLDFAFNRGNGLFKRPQLKNAGKSFSSLALLIIAVSEDNNTKIIRTLQEETYNTSDTYYSGLELREWMNMRYMHMGIITETITLAEDISNYDEN